MVSSLEHSPFSEAGDSENDESYQGVLWNSITQCNRYYYYCYYPNLELFHFREEPLSNVHTAQLVPLKSILTNHRNCVVNANENCRIFIVHGDFWKTASTTFKRTSFDVSKHIKVMFVGEPCEDFGGPLLQCLHSLGFTKRTYCMFCNSLFYLLVNLVLNRLPAFVV